MFLMWNANYVNGDSICVHRHRRAANWNADNN